MATTYPITRWNIGAASITRVIEIEGASPCTFFFKETRPEQLLQHAWLKPHFLTEEGRVRAFIHCFVIQSEGRSPHPARLPRTLRQPAGARPGNPFRDPDRRQDRSRRGRFSFRGFVRQ